jgi:ABC-type Fe3+/spermidine/putrescine transport system ATPase subunit
VIVSIRPEHIELFRERPDRNFNVIKGRVERMTYIGEYSDLVVKVGSADLRVHSPSHLVFRDGSHVYLSFPPELCNLLVH